MKQKHKKINKIFNDRYTEEHYYKAITFNYTYCLDRVWTKDNEIGKHRCGGIYKSEFLSDLLHIHGALVDNDMIIGINDDEQIVFGGNI